MSNYLVIVESPAKAKTIEGYLGKSYKVLSSFGHIRDLTRKKLAIDIENGFEPEYEVSVEKKKNLKKLQDALKGVDEVLLATDEDREGEAIAWHLAHALKLDVRKTKRIVFQEVTKKAILNAIQTPRTINLDLVNGQQARRLLDRLVGYELSPVLWRKVKGGLSAGRVQSVAVRFVVERELSIRAFKENSKFRLVAQFAASSKPLFWATLKTNFDQLQAAEQGLLEVKDAQFEVSEVVKKPLKRSPKPPFTTSTLQQEAAAKLGFSVKRTMSLAQSLYESGMITYMRTDSVSLSDDALAHAKQQILGQYGEKYYQRRIYKTKNQNAQEAHEAIRPTRFDTATLTQTDAALSKLYQLIYQRTIASQMTDAEFEKTQVKIAMNDERNAFSTEGEVQVFAGFLSAYNFQNQTESSSLESIDQEVKLPPLSKGQSLRLCKANAKQIFSRPPARYTEAALVRQLEMEGIGRPSTYAPTITTIQNRGYVEMGVKGGVERNVQVLHLENGTITRQDQQERTGSEKNKLIPTDIAIIVTHFLEQHFTDIVDYKFTAKVEAEFDQIALGKLEWREMLTHFYQEFHQRILQAETVSRAELSQSRHLGLDPKSGLPVSVRLGRFGPFAQIGDSEKSEQGLRFASLQESQRLDDVTLEDVLPLFEMPKTLGVSNNHEEVTVNTGRFGPYLKYTNLKATEFLNSLNTKEIELVPQNIPLKDIDPWQIQLDQAMEQIQASQIKDQQTLVRNFVGSTIQILSGRWGVYITDGTKRVKPSAENFDAQTITVDQCVALLEKGKVNKRMTKQYFGGGYLLLYEPEEYPLATFKLSKRKQKTVAKLITELQKSKLAIRLISKDGAKK